MGVKKPISRGVCKSEFPRTAWLTDNGLVPCPCKAVSYGMAVHGRKNRLGSLHGPYRNECRNCCHPALLASLRGVNVDVQLPYRLPFDCGECGRALSRQQRRDIVHAVQHAQTGYCADCCAKNQPMAFHGLKEFQKGHQTEQKQCEKESIN